MSEVAVDQQQVRTNDVHVRESEHRNKIPVDSVLFEVQPMTVLTPVAKNDSVPLVVN